MEYIQLTMNDYLQSKEEIKKDLGGIVKSFVRIGWHLTRINASRAYELDGYKSITEFAKAEYDMNAPGVTKFMKVYEKCSVPGDTPELQDRYKGFKFNILVELLQLPEEDQAMFEPGVKREAIRDYREYLKENENSPDQLLNWKNPPKEPEDPLGKTILEFFRANKDALNDLYGSSAYTAGNLKEMVEIINPSGNRSYRFKTVFLMMYEYEKGVRVSEFGKGQQDIKWEEFFSVTQEIFKEAAAGPRTWENYFEPKTEIAPAQDEQIPGQDSITNHPEYMPAPQPPEEPANTSKSKNGEEISPAKKQEPEKEKTEPEQNKPVEKEPDFEPSPGNMISLCYSCTHWSECNVKSSTVTNCNEYVCKIEKTQEQLYAEEQAKIDRKTKEKLREKAQEEKMEHLPSESGRQTYCIRLGRSNFNEVAAGIRAFDLRKKDRDYKVGDILDFLEFADGRHTGRTIKTEITYIMEEGTGLEDGYCILAFKSLENRERQ